MLDDLDFKISMLLDGELDSEEALKMYDRIRNEPELRAKWLRYNAASCAVKGSASILPDSGFFDRVSKALEEEPVEWYPRAMAREEGVFRKPSITIALAASVAVIGVLVWSGIPSLTNLLADPTSRVSLAVAPQATLPSPIIAVKSKPDQLRALPKRLNDYLITHNESTYTMGAQTMMPYARVVSYSYGR